MSTVTPGNSGGAATSWSISPSPPTGLSFNTSTGAINGTPTTISSSTSYTTASNAGGSGTATVTIQINDIAPSSITYTPNSLSLTKDTTMTTATPTSSGGAVTSWSISPSSLPAGLSFSTSTGAISGTPTVTSSSTSYTVLQATPVEVQRPS